MPRYGLMKSFYTKQSTTKRILTNNLVLQLNISVSIKLLSC